MKPEHLPNMPFATEDFSSPGGGVDFLGLRWVNYNILAQYLIPGLNNQTTDMGMFFIGGWIPWKFQNLCSCGKEKEYTEKNYRKFREKVEVALSLTFQAESNIKRVDGEVRNHVGIAQSANLPCELNFKTAKRKDQNSLYAAAIYGPAIRSLGIIESYHSEAESGKPPLNIAVADTNPETSTILRCVDECMSKSVYYDDFASLSSPIFDWKAIRSLGEAGLDPARYRGRCHEKTKEAFARLLLPENQLVSGYPRTLTTRLILETVQTCPGISHMDLRKAWYTGFLPNRKKLQINDLETSRQRSYWSVFMSRQYQRYAIELFLWCFEDALLHGARTVDEVIDHWEYRTKKSKGKLKGSFNNFLKAVADDIYSVDDETTSRKWNTTVHGGDDRFEHKEDPKGDKAVIHGLHMLAGWYWRMLVRQNDDDTKKLMELGEADRMGIKWFLEWLCDRKELPIRAFLHEIFSNLIFAQHVRIALLRFDGSAQRLRFLVGDNGIEPTKRVKDIGNLALPFMADRLNSLISLLCDCDILKIEGNTVLLGTKAKTIKPK